MKHSFFTIAALAALCSCSIKDACTTNADITAKGPVVTRSLNLDNFSSISAGSLIKVKYSQQPGKVAATLSCPQDVIDYFSISVSNGKLTAKASNNASINMNGKEVVLTVSSPDLNKVDLSGCAELEAKSLSTTDFSLVASGASELKIGTLSSDVAKFNLSGSSELELSTVVTTGFDCLLSGASELDIDHMKINTLNARLSGSAELSADHITATSVTISASGASEAELSGQSATGKFSASGSADIKASKLMLDNASADASGAASIVFNAQNVTGLHSTGASSVNNAR